MQLDPAPNLVHHLSSHMTSHLVGVGSGLLPAFYGHKEVAEAGIQDKSTSLRAPNASYQIWKSSCVTW